MASPFGAAELQCAIKDAAAEMQSALEEVLASELSKLRTQVRLDVRQEMNELAKTGKALGPNLFCKSSTARSSEDWCSSSASRYASAIAAAAAAAGNSGYSIVESRVMTPQPALSPRCSDADLLGHQRRVFHSGILTPKIDQKNPHARLSASQFTREVKKEFHGKKGNAFRRSRTSESQITSEPSECRRKDSMVGAMSEKVRVHHESSGPRTPQPTLLAMKIKLPGAPDPLSSDEDSVEHQTMNRLSLPTSGSRLMVPTASMHDEVGMSRQSSCEGVISTELPHQPIRSFHDNRGSAESRQQKALAFMIDSDEKELTCTTRCYCTLARVVLSDRFDHTVGFVVLLYAMFLGVQTSLAAELARSGIYEDYVPVTVLSFSFGFIFSVEIALRLAVHGRNFFVGPDWKFNVFDFLLVAMQVIEILIVAMTLADGNWKGGAHAGGSSVFISLRILRGLRLIRIMRVARLMHLFSELRSMIGSIVSTFRSLVWTLTLLSLLVYSVGVYFCQVVTDHGKELPDDTAEGTDLHRYYGSVGRSILTLFMAITGGVDWHEVCDPLIEQISPVMGIVFSLFVAFTLFSVLNVITGIFVDSALRNSKDEADINMINYLHSVFKSGRITVQELERQLDDPKMIAYFASIDLHTSEARFLFQLLDINGSGSIDSEDFIMGCLRLRGPAKAIDLAALMSETRRFKVQWHQHIRTMEESLLVSPDSTSRASAVGVPLVTRTATSTTCVAPPVGCGQCDTSNDSSESLREISNSGNDAVDMSIASRSPSTFLRGASMTSLDWLEEDNKPLFARTPSPVAADDPVERMPSKRASSRSLLASTSG